MIITNCLTDGVAEVRRMGISPVLITLGTITYRSIKTEGGRICRFRDGPKFDGIKIKVSDNKYEMRVT